MGAGDLGVEFGPNASREVRIRREGRAEPTLRSGWVGKILERIEVHVLRSRLLRHNGLRGGDGQPDSCVW